jgi:hypothetical protein
MIGQIKKDVCVEINNKLGVTNPSGNPPNVTSTCWGTHVIFTGTYATGVTYCGVAKKEAGCVYDVANGGNYYFFRVLIVR